MKQKNLILALIIVALMACSLPVSSLVTPTAGRTGVMPATASATRRPTASITPTAFQPLDITLTPSPTPTPTFTPTPTRKPATPTPTLDPDLVKKLKGQTRILVMGSDERPGGGYRTDVMMLVIVNPDSGTASVISFPRDLYVTVYGWGEERLNTAMQFGFETAAATYEYNFGVRPEYYVMTNFSGFIEIINALGGVNVTASQTLHDKCDLLDTDIYKDGYCTVKQGEKTWMDGKMALWYVRSRYSTSDFDRLRRAQEVVEGIFVKLLRGNAVRNAKELYRVFGQSVQTNINLETVIGLLALMPRLAKEGHIHRYVLTTNEAIPYVMQGGAQVLLPNYAAIRQIIQEAAGN